MEPNSSEDSPGDAKSPPYGQELLQDRLDDLILSYLDLIDTYTQLQKDICQNFSEVQQPLFIYNNTRSFVVLISVLL